MSTTTKHVRRAAVAPLLLALALATGCGAEEEPPAPAAPATSASTSGSASPEETTPETPSETATEAEAPEGVTVEMTVKDGEISPSGERVEVGVGETVTFRVTSDRAGEMHVHSTPEQEYAYAVGKTDIELSIDRPGVVEVEDHDAGLVIVQLQVS